MKSFVTTGAHSNRPETPLKVQEAPSRKGEGGHKLIVKYFNNSLHLPGHLN